MLKSSIDRALSRPASPSLLWLTLLLASGVLYALLWQADVQSDGRLFHILLFGR